MIANIISGNKEDSFKNVDFGTSATLHEVRITPCPNAVHRRPCILKKGTNVTIEVDFTPSTYNRILSKHLKNFKYFFIDTCSL